MSKSVCLSVNILKILKRAIIEPRFFFNIMQLSSSNRTFSFSMNMSVSGSVKKVVHGHAHGIVFHILGLNLPYGKSLFSMNISVSGSVKKLKIVACAKCA